MVRETFCPPKDKNSYVYEIIHQEVPEVDAFIAELLAVCAKHGLWVQKGHWEDENQDYVSINKFPALDSQEIKKLATAFVWGPAMEQILAKRLGKNS